MNKSQSHLYHEEKQWFYIALTTLLLSFVAYVYLVSASVSHVVMRKGIDQEVAILKSDISQFESEYIEIQQSVNSSLATTFGFNRTEDKIFIEQSKGSLVLSRN